MSEFLTTNYCPLPISFTQGEGIWLMDAENNRYLDAISSIAVSGLGHCHPRLTETIQAQAKTLLHTSNGYRIANQEKLAERLVKLSGMKRAFFCNSGAEANEAAIKLCRLYGHKKEIANPHIIVMERGYHGRTLATLSASDNRKLQAGFEPLVSGFIRAPFNDIEALRKIAEHSTNVVAVMLEPIQGEGGIHIPDDDYLAQVHELCQQQDWLMVCDEVLTGMGRTGKLFCFQHSNIKPDVVTLAKGLGNGIPIGSCLVGEKAEHLFQPGSHGATSGGNPFSTAVALTVLDILEENSLVTHVSKMGNWLLAQLRESLANIEEVVEVRGKGFLIGIELRSPAPELPQKALQHKLLINVTRDHFIRLMPPLIIQEKDAAELCQRLVAVLTQ